MVSTLLLKQNQCRYRRLVNALVIKLSGCVAIFSMSSWLWGMGRPASFSRCIQPCMLRLAITCKANVTKIQWGKGEQRNQVRH